MQSSIIQKNLKGIWREFEHNSVQVTEKYFNEETIRKE